MARIAKKYSLVLLGMVACAFMVMPAGAQQDRGYGQQDRSYTIDRAQAAVRDRILERDGRDTEVRFNNDPNVTFVSNAQRVTGTGSAFRSGRRREFTYDSTVNTRNGNVQNVNYNWRGNWSNSNDGYSGGGSPGGFGGGRPPGGGGGWNNASRPNGSSWVRGAITNAESGKSLDVPNWSREDGTPIQQWTFAGQPNQRWEVIRLQSRNTYAIVNENSNRVLDVSNGSRDDGARVQQYRWGDQDNQKWQIMSTGGGLFRIMNLSTGKCLDVRDKNRNDGAEIHQWQCNGDRSQMWRLGR